LLTKLFKLGFRMAKVFWEPSLFRFFKGEYNPKDPILKGKFLETMDVVSNFKIVIFYHILKRWNEKSFTPVLGVISKSINRLFMCEVIGFTLISTFRYSAQFLCDRNWEGYKRKSK